MIHAVTRSLILSAFICLPFLSSAQENQTPVASLFGKFVTVNDLAPPAQKLNEMAKALNVSKDMAQAQYSHGRLAETVMEAVLNDYAEKNNIVLNENLVNRFIDVFGADIDSARNEPQNIDEDEQADNVIIKVERSARDIAEEQVMHWQIEKAIYEEFGGPVVFRSNAPQFPVGAYNQLLKQYREAGKFRILDERYAALFWKTFEPPYNAELEPQQVDFSHPWWY